MDTRQLQQSMLFRGMTELEITKALQVLEAHEKSFQKGETLLIAGTITERMGLVLEGSVTIESNDAWGNRTIISHVGQGQVFAETYALLENEKERQRTNQTDAGWAVGLQRRQRCRLSGGAALPKHP